MTQDPAAAAAAVSDAYDRLSAGYDDTYSDEVSRSEDRRLMRTLGPELLKARSVFEVGCGTGWLLDNAPKLLGPGTGRQWCGFDLSQGMLDRLTKKHPWAIGQVWTGDLNTDDGWDVGRAPADLVVSTYASPSYARDVRAFLERCHRQLRRGGRVALVPHAHGNDLRAPYLTEAMDAYIGDRSWSERGVIRDLEAAGFEDVVVTGMRHPLFGPGEQRSRLTHDLWMRAEGKLFRADSMSFLVVTATAR